MGAAASGLAHPLYGHGKLCYVEIPAHDVDAAAAFFQAVCGWRTRRRGDGALAFDDGAGEVSGSWVAGRIPATPGLLLSIMVGDLAATVAAVALHGGGILQPPGPGAGERTAQISDPAGNTWCLYQSGSLGRAQPGAAGQSRPTLAQGKLCYLELPAADPRSAAQFYQRIFNWRIRQDEEGNTAFDDSVGEVSGMWVPGRPAAAHPGLLVYIMVDDAAACVREIEAAGGRIVQPLGADAPELTARFSDPAGNVLAIYQQPAAH